MIGKNVIKIAVVILIIFTSLSYGQDKPSGFHNLQLGHIEFLTSTKSSCAQAHFEDGVLLLHHFMYKAAIAEFKKAQLAAPNYAMSYWGEAFAYKHFLWSYEDRSKAREVISKLNTKNLRVNPYEKLWIKALEVLFATDDSQMNENNYLQKMSELYTLYPNDPNVASFYALGLLGYAGDFRQAAISKERLALAKNILEKFIARYPQHPGVQHYFIHSIDVPNTIIPPLAFQAINNINHNFKDSAHVLHMISHVHEQQGDWENTAKDNRASIKAGRRMCVLEGNNKNLKSFYACDADNIYHSLEWLHYSYLQLEQKNQAATLMKEMKKITQLENQNIYYFWLYRMMARQILWNENYQPITRLVKPIVETSDDKNWAAYSECGMLLAQGISAVKNNQPNFLNQINLRFYTISSLLNSVQSLPYKNACELSHQEFLAYTQHDNKPKMLLTLRKVLQLEEKVESSAQTITLPILPGQDVYYDLLHADQTQLSNIRLLYKNQLKHYPNWLLAKKHLRQLDHH